MGERSNEYLLRESRERYDALVQYLPDGIVVHSDLRIVFANEAALRMLGASSMDELMGQPILPFVYHDSIHQLEEKVQQFLKEGRAIRAAYKQFIRLDGKIVKTQVQAVPISFDGKPAVQLIIRDLSDWIRMEETLHEKDDLYKTLVEHVVAGVFVEQRGVFAYLNPYLTQMLGFTSEEMVGRKLEEFVDQDELDVLRKSEFFLNNTGQKQFPFRIKGRHRDGSTVYLEGNSALITFDGEEALLGTVQDVTMKYEREKMLLHNAKLYQRIMMCIPEPIVITHGESVIYVNRYAMELIGATDDSCIVGRSLFDYIHEHDRECVKERLLWTMSIDEPTSFTEAKVILPDGRVLEVEASNISIDNYMGKRVVLSVIRDLTERKRAEERMLRSEKLSVIGQLAAGVAHEIRNPLTALKGFTQLLRTKYRDETTYFGIMEGELDRINLIVNEFMTLAKPHLSPFQLGNVNDILQSVVSILDTQAILMNVEIVYRPLGVLPLISCNENQLKQVFVNIIKNAVEAMPGGGEVDITAQTLETPDGQFIHIRIKDEGLGIPEDMIKRLGEPFVTTKEKGTGLGLMVSTRIIEAHQGSMHIHSVPGEGTIVEVSLPVRFANVGLSLNQIIEERAEE
ncbi:PAS domain S-box protein [Paenibacillus paeoniae]|uniref:histidine kinase n=1 Tax=Paenibacillus paeoniae TaxID=2292705 RepID=A0A371PHM3_9BACL|nr:PAS domain S-box protein [Paenibacillus paeoniae]REK75736.1 PAS domain S-box protein [Paenibacillus paeoniae]